MNYDKSVKVHTYDAVNFQANRRIEFRLPPNTAFRSNLRLVNMGFRDTNDTANGKANDLVGCLGNIKSVRLMDKGVEISKATNVHPFLSFQNAVGSNVNIRNVSDIKLQSNISLSRHPKPADPVGGLPATYDSNEAPSDIIEKSHTNATQSGKVITNDAPIQGVLELSRVLPILSVLRVVPTNLFTNLKIVIEFFSNAKAVGFGGTDTQQVFSNADLPNLIALQAEELLGEAGAEAQRNISSMSWNEMEHDEITVPRAQQNVQQSVSKRIKGFDNKSINRILFFKRSDEGLNVSGTTINGYGANNSHSFLNEKFNLVVNGRSVLSGEGVDTNAGRLAMTADAWGDYVGHIGMTELNCSNQDNWLDDGKNNMRDYIGLNVGQKIQDLQLKYQRFTENGGGAGDNFRMVIDIYAEVGKSLVISGSGYSIVYN